MKKIISPFSVNMNDKRIDKMVDYSFFLLAFAFDYSQHTGSSPTCTHSFFFFAVSPLKSGASWAKVYK